MVRKTWWENSQERESPILAKKCGKVIAEPVEGLIETLECFLHGCGMWCACGCALDMFVSDLSISISFDKDV